MNIVGWIRTHIFLLILLATGIITVTITFNNPFARNTAPAKEKAFVFVPNAEHPDLVAHWITNDLDNPSLHNDISVFLFRVGAHDQQSVADIIQRYSPWMLYRWDGDSDDNNTAWQGTFLFVATEKNDSPIMLVKIIGIHDMSRTSAYYSQACFWFSRLVAWKKTWFTLDKDGNTDMYRMLPTQLP
ncbi:MAG: hypothetical protein KGI50_04750 [Patescibacteria group bacterium]|nr:hypothetical protein [Patescibacteria group bacterium]MDE2438653.1 hypothetical protein [Patescibacteria group bacterium]